MEPRRHSKRVRDSNVSSADEHVAIEKESQAAKREQRHRVALREIQRLRRRVAALESQVSQTDAEVRMRTTEIQQSQAELRHAKAEVQESRAELLEAKAEAEQAKGEVKRTEGVAGALRRSQPVTEIRERVERAAGYARSCARSVWTDRSNKACTAALEAEVKKSTVTEVHTTVASAWYFPGTSIVPDQAALGLLVYLPSDWVFTGDAAIVFPACAPIAHRLRQLERFIAETDAEFAETADASAIPSGFSNYLTRLCVSGEKLTRDDMSRLTFILTALCDGNEWITFLKDWTALRAGALLSFVPVLNGLQKAAATADVITLMGTDVGRDDLIVRLVPFCTEPEMVVMICNPMVRVLQFYSETTANEAHCQRFATPAFREDFFLTLVPFATTAESVLWLAGVLAAVASGAVSQCHVFAEETFAKNFFLRLMNAAASMEAVIVLCKALAAVARGPYAVFQSTLFRDRFFGTAASFAVDLSSATAVFDALDAVTEQEDVDLPPPTQGHGHDSAQATLPHNCYCTARFRDIFFLPIFGHLVTSSWTAAPSFVVAVSTALVNITTGASLDQRAVFATSEFRHGVIIPLIRFADGDREALAAVRTAFMAIAVRQDGSLHEVFTTEEFRVKALLPMAARRTTDELFEELQAHDTHSFGF